MDTYGRIDILIANAGILRDKSFGKMELKDFEAVMAVHLMGTVKPTKAIWPIMKEQGYGRIVVTTSSTGLYGKFGQNNYGAAKASLVGFMHSLKLEGAKDNIRVNAICPVAATRMTENLLPPAIQEMLKPEYVSPAVSYLVSEDAPTGLILTAAAGVFAVARLEETDGVNLGHQATAEDIAAHFDQIADWSSAKAYGQGGEQNAKFLARLQDKPALS
jgi:NAD(P)-dependent dehydrogenase (short-subunit alcohol dehydrogenase family)